MDYWIDLLSELQGEKDEPTITLTNGHEYRGRIIYIEDDYVVLDYQFQLHHIRYKDISVITSRAD